MIDPNTFDVYFATKPHIQDGDLIAWNGTGYHLLDSAMYVVMKKSKPVIHVSTAFWLTCDDKPVLTLWEAMQQGQVFDSFDRRILGAKDNLWYQCWWLPLAPELRAKLDLKKMRAYMLECVESGIKYDSSQAALSVTKIDVASDDSRLFCSEAHLFALQAGGLSDLKPSQTNPAELIDLPIHRTCQLLWFSRKPLELTYGKYWIPSSE